ncbi:hypothetical protein GIB67_024327 [Kingdonia uniflora]|uniref:F-box/LRR-repeat protein 15-like leucin rich repeat domain-containing protein n=1 Tax=Kingdonia uniflora TaxID=39325 RepID=A0A7J7LF43_9MAGN|nr:hypothetical protein GIB67_024327 [Kingdonia uniflora]
MSPKRTALSSFSPHDSHSLVSVLSEDLLLKILDKLDQTSDFKSWRLVSKECLRLESTQRKSLRVFRHDSLPSLLGRYRDLDTLDLSVCPRIDDATVGYVFGLGSVVSGWTRNLRRLVLRRASGLRWVGLEVVVRSCPKLEEIDLSYCVGVGDREASAISCAKGLKDLKLVKCLGVTDFGLAKIAVGCVKLEILSLKWCLEITDLGIGLLAKKCCNLKNLDISYLKVTNESLCSISLLQKLESLTLIACSFVDNEGLHFLRSGNSSLQSIDISRCDNLTSSGLIAVTEGHLGLRQITASYCFPELAAPLVSKFKDLKILNAIKIDGARVSATILHAIGVNCTNLVEIGLSKCEGVTDEGIVGLVPGCGNLEIVDLTCCNSITDMALSAIANSCRSLVCIKLESCGFISEKGLDQLASYCSHLEEIDLTDCSGVNDRGMVCLSRCSGLISLKLGLCLNISDKGLSHIGSSCTKLQELDLYRLYSPILDFPNKFYVLSKDQSAVIEHREFPEWGCTGISDDGLLAVSVGCKKLKKLNVSYCEQIGDRGLKYISTLEELSDLEMRKLLKVTRAGLVAIAAGCKSLTELDMKRCYNISDTGFWALAQYSSNLRQINLSYCPITSTGLCMAMGNLKCLQDAKLVHLTHVSVDGYEVVLRASCDKLKKVKLLGTLKHLLSSELLLILQARGCTIRWIEKDLVLV